MHSPSAPKKHSGFDSRAQSKAAAGDHVKTSKDAERFDAHISALRELEFPGMRPEDSLKNRISTVEHFCEVQSHNNQITYETLGDTKDVMQNARDNLEDSIEQLRLKFQQDIGALRREYDHRFELQMAENKRLQASFASLKGETVATNNKLALTIGKLRELCIEFGIEDDAGDQDSFSALALSVSRPSTVN